MNREQGGYDFNGIALITCGMKVHFAPVSCVEIRESVLEGLHPWRLEVTTLPVCLGNFKIAEPRVHSLTSVVHKLHPLFGAEAWRVAGDPATPLGRRLTREFHALLGVEAGRVAGDPATPLGRGLPRELDPLLRAEA